MREQNHVTNRRRVRQQHHQPVDTDTFTCSRRHAVLQCTDEVGVEMHGFVITGILLGHLGVEAFGLVFGVVQFRIGVGDLAATDKQLETIGHVRIFVIAPRQR